MKTNTRKVPTRTRKPVNLTIDPSLLSAAKDLAQRQRRTLGSLIEIALEKLLGEEPFPKAA